MVNCDSLYIDLKEAQRYRHWHYQQSYSILTEEVALAIHGALGKPRAVSVGYIPYALVITSKGRLYWQSYQRVKIRYCQCLFVSCMKNYAYLLSTWYLPSVSTYKLVANSHIYVLIPANHMYYRKLERKQYNNLKVVSQVTADIQQL